MKKIILLVVFLFLTLNLIAQVYVNGYYRKDGTYVEPHYRSNPDGNPYNNWSFPGNVNPYTGKVAKGNPDTYLSNYYKLYGNTASPSYYSYRDYSSNLLYTEYTGLKVGQNYNINNTYGDITGYLVYSETNTFKIYDSNWKLIGTVNISKDSKRYTVFDLSDNKVATNRKNPVKIILYIIAGGLAISWPWLLLK